MADLTLKQNDTRPTLSVTLKEGNPATPINLTTATSVTFYMKTASGSLVTRAATISSASGGVVTVTLQAADTATVGVYNCEFQILWADSGVETVPNNGYFTLELVDDLGP